MSDNLHAGLNEKVDLDTAEQVMSSETSSRKDPELGKMLPKLSKRISQSSTQGLDGASPSSDRADEQRQRRTSSESTPLDTAGVSVSLEGGEEQQSGRAVRHQTRASVTGVPNAAGGITVVVRAPVGLSPEAEKLRTQDINPDENSAAYIALTATNHSSAASSSPEAEGEGGPVVKRRMSMSRQLSGKYQRSTNRKVEGREIQQDHSQYALTYGLMLGIRVMTGRRDLAMDKRESMSRKKAGGSRDSADLRASAGSSPTSHASDSTGPGAGLSFSTHSHKVWESEAAQQMLVERELTVQDFEDDLELKFRPQGSSGPPVPTPPHKLNFSFKFKDYMPAVFRAVRALSNIDEADYMMSLAGDFNYIEFIANSKSGQFFFYSHDGCYMIKTQSKEECVLLRDIMPKYVQHLSVNPSSLLVRFYGMHRVKFKTSKIYFVIMSSVFNTEKPIDIKYDLKGSLAGRRTSPESCKQGAVQKDLNLLESGRKIRLGEENIDVFHDTLKADVALLASLNIMDYSLLVGIHDKKASGTTPSSAQRRASGVVLSQQQKRASMLQAAPQPADAVSGGASVASVDGSAGGGQGDYVEVGTIFQSYYGGIPSARGVDEIYFMGIIDILQLYNLNKQTETFYKGLFSDRMLQSSIRPDLYAQRMLDFILKHTDYDEVMAQRAAAAKAAADAGAAVNAERKKLL